MNDTGHCVTVKFGAPAIAAPQSVHYVGPSDLGGRGVIVPLILTDPLKPISIRGQNMPTILIRPPPHGFEDLPTDLLCTAEPVHVSLYMLQSEKHRHTSIVLIRTYNVVP